MRPTLKRISTIDGHDPAVYAPGDPKRFALVLRLFVGPSSGLGEESFDLTVCTPLWLQDKCERDGFFIGRHHLVVIAYDFEFIRRTLVRLVERYSGATWQDVAAKVSRIGYWEFEDYTQPDEAS
jgi:Immunity protein 8